MTSTKMKNTNALMSLSEGQKSFIIRRIQEILWYSEEEKKWSGNISWNSDTVDAIARVLIDKDLCPVKY